MNCCAACKYELQYVRLYDYVQCNNCGSINYVSDRSADEDNKEYFDNMFKTLEERKNNQWKWKIFKKFIRKDQRQRKKQYSDFHVKREQILKKMSNPAKVLEIGFGSGEHLYSLLKRGVDAYGLDLSITAVRNFQEKYPEFANRIRCGARFDEQVDVIYCCALFEHLDKPDQFLQDATNCLNKNGFMIIDGLPILSDAKSDLTVEEDINFWKPCHRIIYSADGLKTLLKRFGFVEELSASYDDYYYRILSLHIKYGYRSIINLRNFAMEHESLPGLIVYYGICMWALRINSLALNGCTLFKKLNI
jgi:SAM-dependent methyltransferase